MNNGWLHANVGIRSLDALICKSIFQEYTMHKGHTF